MVQRSKKRINFLTVDSFKPGNEAKKCDSVTRKWLRLNKKVGLSFLFAGNLYMMCRPEISLLSRRIQWRELQMKTPNDTKRHLRKGCWISFTYFARKMRVKQYSPCTFWKQTNKKPAACLLLQRVEGESILGVVWVRTLRCIYRTMECSKTNCGVALSSAARGLHLIPPDIMYTSQSCYMVLVPEHLAHIKYKKPVFKTPMPSLPPLQNCLLIF